MGREASASSLDSCKRNRNRWCGALATMGPVEGPDGPRVCFARLDCKSWNCAACGPKKAAQVRRGIAAAAKEHGLNRFLTLTLDPGKVSEDEDLVWYIRGVWRKFRVYLKRRHGERVKFISVLEEHKSGVPHLHVLLDRYIPQAWIAEAWNALGGGRIVFIERVQDLAKVGWYLGKYLTKEMLRSEGRGVKRYTASRGISIMPKRGGTGWIRAPADIEELRRAAGAAALEIREDEMGRLKSFTADRPLRRSKALGGRLVFEGKRAARKSDGQCSKVEMCEAGVPARGVEEEEGRERARETSGRGGILGGVIGEAVEGS